MSIERIEILKERMRETFHIRSIQGLSKNSSERDAQHIWFPSYDELEKLLDDKDFEEFVDTLD